MKSFRFLTQTMMLALLFAVLAAGTSAVQRRMNMIRRDHELTDTAIVENAPPIVALTTVALGSFRGLVADVLWLRSSRMQEQGNYFEMVQLASWITKLQPRFTGATAFLAWNMAYNVSVTCNSFEDRWRWVQRGIELIRDEALVYNPGDPELFKELGWIYQHKLGQEMDDANRYYKVQLAKDMMTVFGTWPVDWEAWSASPRTEAALRDTLGDSHPLFGFLAAQELELADLEEQFRESGALPESLRDGVADAAELDPLECYLRVRWLEARWKIDARRVFALNEKYGQLDWRLPEAYAIYWASRGLEEADVGLDIACERMVFQGLSAAYRGGRAIYFEEAETLEITPNVSLVDAVNAEYLVTIERHPENRSIQAGYENWLIDAVVTLYTFGREDQAGEYLTKLRELSPHKPQFRKPLEVFALYELAGDIASATYDQGNAAVQGYLYQMCYALAMGDLDRGDAFDRIARRIWQRYMRDIGGGAAKRRGLAPYRDMKRNMYRRCLQSFPPLVADRLRQAAANLQGAEELDGPPPDEG